MTDTLPKLSLSDFDYRLPEELIARYPLERRDASRMMQVSCTSGDELGSIHHRHFTDITSILQPGDLLVLNNTKVLPARLLGRRQGHTGKVELLLLHPSPGNPDHWSVLMKPSRKLKPGTVIEFDGTEHTATIEQQLVEGHGQISLSVTPDAVEAWLQTVGHMPIPPYLNRQAEASDKDRYQTVFAKAPGAQAAPTAGLHFTPEILAELSANRVQQAEVTLSVGLGTFRPVLHEDVSQHTMHGEWYCLPEETATAVQQTQARGGRVVAVGTTVMKTLETVALAHGGSITGSHEGWSDLFIKPGFQFNVVDALLTNFHLPKSTLLMLVSAFSNHQTIMEAYRQAVTKQYRFYSYGDCMLIA